MTRAEYQAQKAMKARMRQTEQKHTQAAKGSMDLPFLILTLLLTVIGLIMLFSASFPRAYYDTGDGTYYFKRQALFAVIGLAGMFVVGKINYQRWRGASRMLVGLALFLLILVIIPPQPTGHHRQQRHPLAGHQGRVPVPAVGDRKAGGHRLLFR